MSGDILSIPFYTLSISLTWLYLARNLPQVFAPCRQPDSSGGPEL